MFEYGITWQPEFLIYTSAVVLAVGAIFLIIGYRPTLAVILLMIYCIPVTFIIHAFWKAPPGSYNIQSILFMKNIAITGGLIHVLIYGTGKYSIRRFFGVPLGPKEKW